MTETKIICIIICTIVVYRAGIRYAKAIHKRYAQQVAVINTITICLRLQPHRAHEYQQVLDEEYQRILREQKKELTNVNRFHDLCDYGSQVMATLLCTWVILLCMRVMWVILCALLGTI